MKKLALVAALLALPTAALADETCGDYMGAVKSGLEPAYSSYQAGLRDMGMADRAKYQKEFMDAPTDANLKSSVQWMMTRVHNGCQREGVRTNLSEVIKAYQ